MIRLATAASIAVLVGYPLSIAPFWLVAAPAGLAGLLCVSGLMLASIRVAGAGATLALIGYAFALWAAPGGNDAIGAIAFGLALSIVVDATSHARRCRNAFVAPSIVPAQLRHWVSRAMISAAAGTMLILAGSALTAALPDLTRPFVAGAGAIAALAVAVTAFRSRATQE